MRSISLAAGLALAAPAAFAQNIDAQTVNDGSQMLDQEGEIRAVIANYFWGRQAGDPEQLGEAFDLENGRFSYVRRSEEGDTVEAMSLAEFASRFDGPLASPNTGRIIGLDIVDDQMAFVKFELAGESRIFIDYFILFRANDAWRIIAKTSAVFPAG